MTQKEKLIEAKCFIMRVKSIASSILDEGNDYDMTWHKSYCKELTNLCNDTLKILRS